MKKYLKFSFVLSVMSFLNPLQAQMLEVDKPAPDFELLDQNGEVHSLRQYLGEWVILYFYPKDDTPGCTKEACAFRDEYRAISAKNTKVLGVSVDKQKSHAAFAAKYSLPFPLLVDTNGDIAHKYDALISFGPFKLAKRHTFLIDPNGIVRKIYRKVDPNNHSQQLLDTLTQLQN